MTLRASMSNPNNCEACDHKNIPDGGHCYMFKDEPTEVCMIHTARKIDFFSKEFTLLYKQLNLK